MNIATLLCFASAGFAILLGLAAVIRKRDSLASWLFFFCIAVLALESGLGGLSLLSDEPANGSIGFLAAAWMAKAFIPGFGIGFSLVFARGNYREFLSQWRFALAVAFIFPIGLVLAFPSQLLTVIRFEDAEGQTGLAVGVGTVGRLLSTAVLCASVVIVTNFEKTFRAAVGTTRWRVKFMVIGVGVVFVARIYASSQNLLFPVYNPAMTAAIAAALLVGCCLMAFGYTRSGFSQLEIYPSQAILQKSVTVIVAGAYLFVVGFLAEVVAFLGGTSALPTQAFIVLLGFAGIIVLLVSDRFNVAMRRFVSRNFSRPEHDFRKIWAQFNHQLSGVVGIEPLCEAASKLIVESLDLLSTNFVLLDPHREQLALVSSTSKLAGRNTDPVLDVATSTELITALEGKDEAFDLDAVSEPWAEAVRSITPVQFPHGGSRFCIRLAAGERLVGILVVSDRVNGTPFTDEELDLLKCIADELAARLLNQNLNEALIQAREMEAFQTMSAFFVHDMKNAASSLNLTLKNFATHYEDPEFREDALRGIALTASRISKLSDRLSDLRRSLELEPVETDLVGLVESVLANLDALPGVRIEKRLRPVSTVQIDREQVHSVVTNLILNAQDAVVSKGGDATGEIRVETETRGPRVQLSVADDGCGMDAEFIKKSLFRPFQSTKKQGLGIGMFQARMIIEAHGGTIQVESEPGKGTLFRISLPAAG